MSVQAIEKDWWVTLVLKALFSLSIAEHFIFKGGTSLSKGWQLIERFSEDIDIALAPEAFGRSYKEMPSISYVKRLKKEGCAFTSTVIRDALETQLAKMGVPDGMIRVEAEAVDSRLPDKDPQTIYVQFPTLFPISQYIDATVKVEFGVRALREPFATARIQSIIAAESDTPAYQEEPFPVTVVEPRKTFMEKLLLLHEKFVSGRATGGGGERQSRHLSDLLQMRKKGILQQVLADPELYGILLHHRKHYVRLKDVDYHSMQWPQLAFLPPWPLMGEFRRDYNVMLEEMIYGNPPDFDTLIEGLRELNLELVELGHSKNIQEVIVQARKQIAELTFNNDEVMQTTVEFAAASDQAGEPRDMEVSFVVEFVQTQNGIVVHRIGVA
jgi:hypothetical protein